MYVTSYQITQLRRMKIFAEHPTLMSAKPVLPKKVEPLEDYDEEDVRVED